LTLPDRDCPDLALAVVADILDDAVQLNEIFGVACALSCMIFEARSDLVGG